MRILRLVVSVFVASAIAAPVASAAVQQGAQDRFNKDATGVRIVASPQTAAASTVTGTVTAKRLGVAANATAGTLARAAVDRYASLLGVSSGSQLRYLGATSDALRQRHVRFEQMAGDVPVYDGLVTVHLAKGADLRGFSASISRATSGAATHAAIDADQARDVAKAQVADAKVLQAPRLVVYTGVPFGSHAATLAWAVDVTSTTQPDRELVFVDAASGRVTDALNRTEFARSRTVYNANGSTTTGTFARGEGDPATGDADVDGAYDGTGATYDYYANAFGRDSCDDAGAGLVSFVHYGVGYENAFWDGAEMVYGDGFAVNDVTAHELTHAVTERTAGLEYVCTSSDNGGVRTNSGIANKVYANLVDTMGRGQAEQIRYRAQTVYLGPNATFADARAAEQQSASDLGYSSTSVGNAWQAQGVTVSWQPSC